MDKGQRALMEHCKQTKHTFNAAKTEIKGRE